MSCPSLMCHHKSGSTRNSRNRYNRQPRKKVTSIDGNEKIHFRICTTPEKGFALEPAGLAAVAPALMAPLSPEQILPRCCLDKPASTSATRRAPLPAAHPSPADTT